MVTLSESTTRTGRRPSRSRAALRAASMVADSFDDRLTHTTPFAPSSAMRSKARTNAPGDGADVSGSWSLPATRDQNSLVVSSTRSTSSSEPKRMLSGTMPMPSSASSSSGRSQALSVTRRMPDMFPLGTRWRPRG